MNLIKVEKKNPIVYEWYLVECHDWCESGYAVAQWDGDNWFDNTGRNDFHDYVTRYYPTPLDEM